jgi:PKD repeat protein
MQRPANSTNAAITGLLPSTTYYWKVYAVTEGCLSNSLNGTNATLAGGVKKSITSGNWNNASTWTPSGVPTAYEDVIIVNTHTESNNTNAECNSLTIGQGAATCLQFVGNARSLTVSKDITVANQAVFNVRTNSNVTHRVEITDGNLINNGTLDFATDANSLCNITFSKNGNQNISGNGTTTDFNLMALNMGNSINNILNVSSTNFTAPANFLTINTGTFKLSSTSALNITPFSGTATIPQKGGLWVNSSQATVNIGATLTMFGNVTVSSGTLNVGNAANEDLLSNGGFLTVSNGLVNIAGKYYATGINNLSKFTLSGGSIIVPSVSSTNTTIAPFQIAGAGSQFSMTGGLLIIPREGGTGAQDLGYVNTGSIGGSVTGGTLQIGNPTTPAGQTISINTNYSIGGLHVNSANATAKLTTNSINVINDVAITSGTLNANGLDITLGRNWSNNVGSFVPGAGTVTFSSASAQTIFKPAGETFNNMVFNGGGTKTLLSAITATNITINSGALLDVNTTNNQVTLKGSFTNNGTFNSQAGLVLMNGTAIQNITGSSTTSFYDLTLNNNAGATLGHAQNLINTLTLNNGTFDTNAQAFTMLSTASQTARIAQITGTGNIIGNVTVQRFVPGGYTGWALLGTPISSTLTLQAWDDDIPISCPACPDGTAGGFNSIYWYDETKPGTYDAVASYIPMTAITNQVLPNRGYWVYLGNGQVTTTNILMDVTGPVRKFNNTIPLTRTNTGSPNDDGWNLIHNPYPSPIKWSLLRGTTANLDNAIYMYNADLNGGAGGHASYVNGISSPAVGAGGIDDVIPMCQGFYVHSRGATALNATEANKVAGNPTFLKMNQTSQVAVTQQMLRLYLDGPSSHHDETVLYIQPGATDTLDQEYDALKMAGQDPLAPLIMLQRNSTNFQINGIAPITSTFSSPLKTTTGYPGTYTISIANFNSFPTGACISLYDTFTGITTDLKTHNYVFTLSASTTTARFVLNITLNPLSISSSLLQPTCAQPGQGAINAVGANSGPWNYYWKDAVGATIKTSLNKATGDTLSNLSSGDYSLEMNTVGQCDNHDSTFTIISVDVPMAQFTAADTVFISGGGNVTFTNTSSNSISSEWNFGDNLGLSSATDPSYNYYTAGIYTVSLVATSNGGCTDTAYKPIVVIVDVTSLTTNAAMGSLLVKTLEKNQYLIQGSVTDQSVLNFKLFDAVGKLVMDYGNLNASNISLPVDLTHQSPGTYFLNITGADTAKTIKLPVR